MRLTGNEKAYIGGLVAGLVTLAIQLQQTGQFTTKEFLLSAGAWLIVHLGVYTATNTPPNPPIAPPPVNPVS